MKKLILILLMALSIPMCAQNKVADNIYSPKYLEGHGYYNINKTEQWKSLAFNVAAVALEAVGDGLLDQGRADGDVTKMRWGHTLQAGSVGVLLAKPFAQNLDRKEWALDIISYTFIRIGIFNPIYNTSRGLPIHYLGTTSWYDKILVSANNPPSSYLWMNTIMLTVGVSIPFNEF